MKILHVTDSHGTAKTPESRLDLYYITFLRKMAEIAYVVNLNKIDMVIHTGDLFHTSRVSNKFMGQVAEVIKACNVPFYVVPGNHDIDGYSLDTIDQTSLGLLAKTGVLKLLTRDNPIRVNATSNGKSFTVAISGQEYYAEIDTGNASDYEMQQDEADINILAAHGYIADTQQHPNIRCTYPKDIVSDADIILSGHYHRSFALDVADVAYYNPGSMMRVEMTEYNKTHMPQYGILEIEVDNNNYVVYDYKFHQFRIAKPSTVVFDFNTATQIKRHSITLENFKTSIANTMQNINVNAGKSISDTLLDVCTDYCTAKSYGPVQVTELNKRAIDSYNDAINKMSNEDAVVRGFIASNIPIKMKSVDIENFQSHENTHIDFSDGLNIVIGESNSGKTAVFRAIDWVIDNQPLGTDFIMTGKKYCKVRVTYDNNTFIERYRTLKETGYYRIGVIQNGKEEFQEFKGFTNNVPIEVMNVHQMPKVNITSNISTHLNKMSQLERPFLITESTNEKASAIGKITGTDVIDTAIGTNASESTNNGRLLKSLIKQKQEIEDKQSTINYIDIKAQQANYITAQKMLASLSDTIKKTKDIESEYGVLSTNINNCNIKIKQCNDVKSQEKQIATIDKLISDTIRLVELYKQYNMAIGNVFNMGNKITMLNTIVAQKGDVEKSKEYINLIGASIDALKIYQLISTNISTASNDINRFSNCVKNKDVISEQLNNINTIRQMLLLLANINNVQCNIQKYSDNSSSIVATIGELDTELQGFEEDLKSFVLSVGICPCCGQKVTDKNVQSIINNFSKEG